MTDRLPAEGRLAGIDFGTVRIGVAICDASQRLASPLATYQRQSPQQDVRYFKRLVEDEHLVGFVVGLPVHTDGTEGQKANEARDFGRWIEEATQLPVVFYDERFTSQEADQLMGIGQLTRKKRKQRRDQIAAQILLASYLDSARQQREGPGALDD